MKVAFILGINHPNFVFRGDIAFTLTDWILKYPKYKQFYRDCNMYKITDNMAAESGVSSPIKQVLEAARLVDSNEIWASDKLYDALETYRLTKKFLNNMTQYDKNRFAIAVIPQGKTLKQWLTSYKELKPLGDIIVLSKYSVPKCFRQITGTDDLVTNRIAAVKFLYRKKLVDKPLHLAGGDHKILTEIKALKKYKHVRSIDSNIAFKLGLYRRKLGVTKTEPTRRLNHNFGELSHFQRKAVIYNIEAINGVKQ